MIKIFTFALCAAVVLSLAGCGTASQGPDQNISSSTSSAPSPDTASTPDSVENPNPFVDCETLEEAEALAGFDITLPSELPGGAGKQLIRAQDGQMIEIIYQNGAGEEVLRIRKAAGSEDVSGDYNSYAEANTVTVNDLQVTMKGEDGKVKTAVWTDGEYAYAISSAAGIDRDSAAELAEAIK